MHLGHLKFLFVEQLEAMCICSKISSYMRRICQYCVPFNNLPPSDFSADKFFDMPGIRIVRFVYENGKCAPILGIKRENLVTK